MLATAMIWKISAVWISVKIQFGASLSVSVLTDLLHEDEHSFSVLLPLLCQLTLMRELITAQEYGQLKAVGVKVAEIIHT